MTDRKVWIAMLAKLTAPHDASKAGSALAAYLPMLTDFPDDAFSVESLGHVARGAKFLPTYAVLRDLLGEWWRDHNPVQRLIGDATPGWDDDDEIWYRYWNRRQAEGFAPPPNQGRPPGGMSYREHVASLVHLKSGKAWARICELENAATPPRT